MPSEETRIPLLIAGLGNILLMDDGVGVHAAKCLQAEGFDGAQVVEVGTMVLDALHLFENAESIIALDAIRADGPPGTIYRITPGDSTTRPPHSSLHEVDLRDVLQMLPTDRQPRLIVLGVEPHTIDYGMDLSPVVAGVLPELVRATRELATSMLANPG